MEKPSTKKPMNVLKTMVFPKNFMEKYKIKLDYKIRRALYRINDEFPEDEELKTPSDIANFMIDWYIRQMFTNGHDYIDRD